MKLQLQKAITIARDLCAYICLYIMLQAQYYFGNSNCHTKSNMIGHYQKEENK